MNAYPFSVFKRTDRPYFLVSFKDETGKYLPPVSTKKKSEAEAMEVAFKWLRDGIPQKKEERGSEGNRQKKHVQHSIGHPAT